MPLRPMLVPAFGRTVEWYRQPHTRVATQIAASATAPPTRILARRAAGAPAVPRNCDQLAGIVTGTVISGSSSVNIGLSSTRPCMKSPPCRIQYTAPMAPATTTVTVTPVGDCSRADQPAARSRNPVTSPCTGPRTSRPSTPSTTATTISRISGSTSRYGENRLPT